MSRILPTLLVFISGYVNTENVFYCLIILQSYSSILFLTLFILQHRMSWSIFHWNCHLHNEPVAILDKLKQALIRTRENKWEKKTKESDKKPVERNHQLCCFHAALMSILRPTRDMLQIKRLLQIKKRCCKLKECCCKIKHQNCARTLKHGGVGTKNFIFLSGFSWPVWLFGQIS